MNDAFGHPQSVLVLGGGSDLAKATVEALVAQRCRKVILAGRRPEVLDATAREIRRSSTAPDLVVETASFDALERESHDKVVADLFQRSGGVDCVIVAFAILGDRPSDQPDPDAAARVIEVNFAGAASAMLAVAVQFRSQGHGTLVVFSSVAGVRVRAANFVYGSSKAGLDGFAQGLADSLFGTAIHVLIVRPGFVATKMTAGMRKPPFTTTPEAVASAIVRGLEAGAPVVWVPPALRYVMAIVRLIPRSVFRRLPG